MERWLGAAGRSPHQVDKVMMKPSPAHPLQLRREDLKEKERVQLSRMLRGYGAGAPRVRVTGVVDRWAALPWDELDGLLDDKLHPK